MAKSPFEKSSGNVFSDIGFSPAEAAELTAKSNLIIAIKDTIAQRKLTQQEAAQLCGTDQPTLSKVFRGRMESVTIDRLASWLTALGRDVEIVVKPTTHKARQGGQEEARAPSYTQGDGMKTKTMNWSGNFQTRYVAFLDILGFKNRIDNAQQDSDLFEYLATLPTRLAEMTKQNDWMGADVQCISFSDSIVISALEKTNSPIGMVPIVNIAKTLFWEFIEHKVVIRGGVAKGDLYHRGEVVFGRAMNVAVELEKDVALFSRIVTNHEIANEWRDYWGKPGGLVAMRDEIREDLDGNYYINLFHFPEGDSLDKVTYAAFKRSGPVLKAMLSEPGLGLKERSKVVWLARQYNECPLISEGKICAAVQIPEPG